MQPWNAGGGKGAELANLLVFEAGADVGELLLNARTLGLLVLAIADVADEDGKAAHARERHGEGKGGGGSEGKG